MPVSSRGEAGGARRYCSCPNSASRNLISYLERGEHHRMDALPGRPVTRRWWEHMKDIMRGHPDGSPMTVTLVEMFHLP
jgi:L-rhamnose mutarotase